MPDDRDEQDDVVAAGASCPIPDCGALAITYRPTEGVGRADSKPWEFTCPRCGIDFTVPEDELILQPVPKEWLVARGASHSRVKQRSVSG
jgi:hypothetical protein